MKMAPLFGCVGMWILASLSLAAQTTPILPAGTYEFAAGNSGLALAAAGTSDGSVAVQQTYTAAANQQWTLTNLGGNTIELTVSGTNEALESPGSSTVAGIHLDVSRYTAATGQQWNMVSVSAGVLELVNVASGYAINVSGNSTSPGTVMCQWNANAAQNERWAWALVLSDGAPPPPPPPTLFILTVTNGSGSGSYAVGTAVTVTANTPASGTVFAGWTSNTAALASASASTTTLTMPASAAAITATYSAVVTPPPPTLYSLTVTNGSGSGSYAAGTVVTVTANAPASGMVFAGWTGNTAALASVSAATTTLTMPASAAAITATYSAVATPPPPPQPSGGSTIANGTYEIVSHSSGLALAATSATDNSAAVQQIYTGAATQQWTVTNLGNNVIELVLTGTDEALDTPSVTAGANLDLFGYEDDESQQWEVETSSSGYIEVVNVDSGYAINVSGNSSNAGTKMCQWNANNSANELWTFTAVTAPGTGGGSTGTGSTGTGSTGTGSTGTASTSGVSPFGVACDAAQSANTASWMPVMASAGVANARVSAAWDQIEATQGTFNYSAMDTIVANATTSHLTVHAILGFNPSWVSTKGGAFPTGSLPDWSTYVANMVNRYSGKITQWEIWNEPDTASNATPADYAATVAAAYTAAKTANSSAQIGITVSEANINWLRQAIAAGAAGHFDYISVHPYTVLDNMSQGWEGDYLGIVKTIRAMLAATDPNRASVPIVFTEIGDRIGYGSITATTQAGDLVKTYAMGMAEGLSYIDWFEAEDGDSGAFGLLDGTGAARPAYSAMKSTIAALGPQPSYQGWVLLNNQDYAFVYNNGTTTALAAWAPPGVTDAVTFSGAVQVINPVSGASTSLTTGSTLSLTNTPVLITGVPADVLATAQANKSTPFPWKGIFSGVKTVSIQLGNPNVESGLHQMTPGSFTPAQVGGNWVEDVSSQSGQNYEVDPNVLTFTSSKIQVTVVAMAKDSSAGFNFKYESANGFAGIGWNGIPNDGQWHTFTFSPTDDEFVGIWGYNFQLNSDSTAHSNYYLKSVTLQVLP